MFYPIPLQQRTSKLAAPYIDTLTEITVIGRPMEVPLEAQGKSLIGGFKQNPAGKSRNPPEHLVWLPNLEAMQHFYDTHVIGKSEKVSWYISDNPAEPRRTH